MSVTTVNSCKVSSCVFNSDEACHALAITIDDPSPTTCGTYKARVGDDVAGATAQVANVGACKAASCKHNKNLLCTAGQVTVGMKGDTISCLSYEER